jgi:hypothetical protein
MWDVDPIEAICVRCSCGCREAAHDLCQYSHLHMGSLGGNKISAAVAWDLGAALQVNTTLTTLE